MGAIGSRGCGAPPRPYRTAVGATAREGRKTVPEPCARWAAKGGVGQVGEGKARRKTVLARGFRPNGRTQAAPGSTSFFKALLRSDFLFA